MNIEKYDYLKCTLYEYCINKLFRVESDYIQLINNIQYRQADTLDLLEMILALNRLQVTQEVLQNVQDILKYIV